MAAKKLQITFFNVGHGSCTHIITPNNQHFLVDVGSDEQESVVNYINQYYSLQRNGQKIDYLIITHPHKDHILDLPTLLRSPISPRVLFREKKAFPIENAQTYSDQILFDCANKMNQDYHFPIDSLNDPENPNYNGGVSFSLHRDLSYHKEEDLNSFSPIIVLSYAGRKVILTGDNNKEILKTWVAEGPTMCTSVKDCDVLLAPHHGRDSDFCPEFFHVANPRLTVVSDKAKEHDTQLNTTTNYKGRGLFINGEERYVVTTRKDGNILVTIEEDGHLNVQLGAFDYGN